MTYLVLCICILALANSYSKSNIDSEYIKRIQAHIEILTKKTLEPVFANTLKGNAGRSEFCRDDF